MRSWVDPSRGATAIPEANTEVIEKSGVKSGIISEEYDTGARSNNNAINNDDNSLRIYRSHSLKKIKL
jgi:hypothetical protein